MTGEHEGSRVGEDPFSAGREVADALLYEGYVLYPYRASAPKNTNALRWQFGVLVPPAYAGEPCAQRTECLLEAPGPCRLSVRLRFLQLQARTEGDKPAWDEAVERCVDVELAFDPSAAAEVVEAFDFGADASVDGGVHRERWNVSGRLAVRVEPGAADGRAVKLTVVTENSSLWDPGDAARHEVVRRSLVAAHTLASVDGGAFVSSLEPPEWAAAAVDACQCENTFPVLVGASGARDAVLSSPIIVYDYPEVAPESPGDFFDSTEIDELLTLRTLTLTDAEKQEARSTDPHAAAIIDRIEALGRSEIRRLHGTTRPVPQ